MSLLILLGLFGEVPASTETSYHYCAFPNNSSFDRLFEYKKEGAVHAQVIYEKHHLPAQGMFLERRSADNQIISRISFNGKTSKVFSFTVLRFSSKTQHLKRYYVVFEPKGSPSPVAHKHSIPRIYGRSELTNLIPFKPPPDYRVYSFEKTSWKCRKLTPTEAKWESFLLDISRKLSM